jgi:glucose/arabinose dehydrogenase
MTSTRRILALVLLAAAAPPAAGVDDAGRTLPLDRIRMPPGFSITLFAGDVPGARSLARGAKGTIFVGTRGEGKVYALADGDGDGRADRVHVLARDLKMPNGVAFREGDLFVAEIDRIHRFPGIEERLETPPPPVTLQRRFPDRRHHGWKFIAFGPDGFLYVPVGAPCNVCEPEEDVFASITRMKPDGSEFEVFARGVRNTVGFDWHPETGRLWFTDNGRDWLGDDRPPDELNSVPEKGLHFGYPYCHGAAISDPEFGAKRPCSSFRPPERELGPHVAALGMRFYTGAQFPGTHRNQIFIAEHGSWNRSSPIGYRITLVKLEGERAVSYEVFAEGWLQGGKPWGRPVDLLVLPDGSLLVSDDHAGAVYRIAYASPRGKAPAVKGGAGR